MIELPNGLHGAYRRCDLIAAFGRHAIRTAVRQGQLVTFHRQVLLRREVTTQLRTRAAAALLLAGERAVLTRHTAARMYGCTAADFAPIDILVPYARRIERAPGVVVHNGTFTEDDIAEIDGLRLLAPEQVLADLLCRARRPTALACADQMLAGLPAAQRPGFRDAVLRAISARADIRGTRQARVMFDLATGLPESPFESQLLLMFYDRELPVPTPQHSITTIDGRELYRLDFAWPEFRIAVEYDGYAAHAERHDQDRRRDEDLAARGWIVIHATIDDLMAPSRLVSAVREALQARRLTA
ncbi:endonuclease domain-containing protein [Kutzneria sp. 744]|uniref:endonuclease domain-containing protein n=1 Tax=Kutzneria sp. (strain 744) TaxID=345341 RepID=UPI0003EEDC99|nr:DUF559 domain-containing protein [Kutzneria sp. 744]EWM15782.1 hypothetical protein KUTG_06086 [Kutzneria sp. 744]